MKRLFIGLFTISALAIGCPTIDEDIVQFSTYNDVASTQVPKLKKLFEGDKRVNKDKLKLEIMENNYKAMDLIIHILVTHKDVLTEEDIALLVKRFYDINETSKTIEKI